MRTIILVFLSFISQMSFSQTNLRIPQRLFNYSLSYGPRNKNLYYSMGYGFGVNGSNATIEVGGGPIMLGLLMFNPNKFQLNSSLSETFVTGNYVYRSKEHNRLFLIGGLGCSVDSNRNFIFRTGVDFQISYPLYLSLHYYQTTKSYFMIGAKIYIF
jgi:hypothetical protein